MAESSFHFEGGGGHLAKRMRVLFRRSSKWTFGKSTWVQYLYELECFTTRDISLCFEMWTTTQEWRLMSSKRNHCLGYHPFRIQREFPLLIRMGLPWSNYRSWLYPADAPRQIRFPFQVRITFTECMLYYPVRLGSQGTFEKHWIPYAIS